MDKNNFSVQNRFLEIAMYKIAFVCFHSDEYHTCRDDCVSNIRTLKRCWVFICWHLKILAISQLLVLVGVYSTY